ncbi:MAG: tetratricopeptide repeat protein [Gemmataceae bacterium]|nr:tetratricopeptide repeat protein [Gemmataceae bacterium]MDW8265635.1 tetratricopeptide repeat protein [Gemmataceae bacterium]
MRQSVVWCLFFVGVAGSAWAEEVSLSQARQRWLRGNYEEAREAYEKLARQPAQRIAAAIGLSRTWESAGEYDKALAVVDEALALQPRSAELHARRAEVLYLRGRWAEAEKAAESALALHPENFPARWVRAQVYRDRGDLKRADAEFRWFVRTYTQRSDAGNDITDPEELLIVGLAGAENARWHNLSDQFKVILNDVWADALGKDKDFWPAEYHSGMLLLEKYNRSEALEAFDKALKINPHAAEALVGKGEAALQKYEITEAERFAERALKVNPRLPRALRLRADAYLAAGNVPAALQELEAARRVNPRDESTLGRIAACHWLRRRLDDFAALVNEVEAHNPRSAIFYYELAERLDERRHYEPAETHYLKAIERQPQLPWARNSLGMLYMRLGREREARDILTKAFEADPFNVRVSNTLKVLRHLERYETLKTPHFEIRYDPANDGPLARYMAKYLEGVYADLEKQFGHAPKKPILVEVFNNHDMFSGRMVALPDLHTIGASTGRVVAMVSPHGRGIKQPFNWARVLRHELVHVFNLDQTNFQVPHWLTEGLAVSQEGYPRPTAWNDLLRQRVPAGELMTLDDIHLGFIRPRLLEDWHMAYCQSQLYVEYLRQTHGAAAIIRLLEAYRDGLDHAAAIPRACGVDLATFEKGYRTYLSRLVAGWPSRQKAKPRTLSQLQDDYDKDPSHVDTAALLAEQYLLRRRQAEARKLADAVLAKAPRHSLAAYVKGKLLLAAGDEAEALRVLEAAVDARNPEPKLLRLLGQLYTERQDWAKAAEVLEAGRKAEPDDSTWLADLARVYAQSGQTASLIGILREQALRDADDVAVRKRLARLLLDAGQPAGAERYAREALEIDLRDSASQALLLQSLRSQKRDAEAEELRRILAE